MDYVTFQNAIKVTSLNDTFLDTILTNRNDDIITFKQILRQESYIRR